MGIALTHDQYVKALKDKGIKLKPLDTYQNKESRLRFKCPKNHISVIRAGMLLKATVTNGCRECRYSERRKDISTYREDLQRVHDGKLKVVGKVYTNAMTKITHQCTRCKHTWDVTPNDILSRKNPCKFCDGNHLTEKKVKEKLKGITDIKMVKYLGNSDITAKCTKCKHVWDTVFFRILIGGCPVCVRDNTNLYAKYECKIGRRTLVLQGYEEKALRWILANSTTRLSDLRFTPAEGKPTIPYRLGGVARRYHPDFYHTKSNTVIEVKSAYTLGILGGSRSTLSMVKAKARATLRAGYKFKLMLMGDDGSYIAMPENWLALNKKQLLSYVNSTKSQI